MTPIVHATVVLVVVLACFLGYYLLGKWAVRRLARRLASIRRHRTIRHGRGLLERATIWQIVLVVTSHVLLVVVALVIVARTGSAVEGLGVSWRTLVLLPFGLLLGLAQMSVSIFVCQVIITAVNAVQSGTHSGGPGHRSRALAPELWTDYSRAGWMRHHLVASTSLPRWLSITLTSGQVACEEIVFRGIIPTVIPHGGLIIAGVLFVVMQSFFMPTWRSAFFPVVGAVLMSVTHGFLITEVPELWPLVVAHAASFFTASRRG